MDWSSINIGQYQELHKTFEYTPANDIEIADLGIHKMSILKGRKTYLLALLYAVVCFAQYLQGDVVMDFWELVQQFVGALTVIALRLGIAKGG